MQSRVRAVLLLTSAGLFPACHGTSIPAALAPNASLALSMELAQTSTPRDQEAAARLALRVEERIVARRQELERARAGGNARTLARHSKVVEVGGYAEDVQRRLARLEESLLGLPEFEGLRALELKGLLLGELDRLRCAHPEIFIVETGDSTMVVRPGTYLIVTGCRFGLRSGSVLMRLTDSGEELPLTVRNWDDDTILVEVPDLSGVPDQEATLQITSHQGELSAPFVVEFVAAREVLVVFAPYMSFSTNVHHLENTFGVPKLTCATSAGVSMQKYWTNPSSFLGYHKQWGDLYPASGRDVIGLSLIHNWKLVEYRIETQAGSGDVPEDGQVTSHSYLSLDRPNTPPDEQWLSFRVYWWVDRELSIIRYELAVIIEGPRGVPYANLVHVDALAQLEAKGEIPGAPCP